MFAVSSKDAHEHVPHDERALCDQLRALDSRAWARLFDEHRDRIWRYALARTGDRDAADDITSQVFVEALESIHRFHYRGKPVLAWLYRLARNHTGKHLRQARRTSRLAFEDIAQAPIDDALETLALAQALASLTPDQAELIALRFFAGYTTREIAGAMGKSESAVYSLEVRAIQSLRHRLHVPSDKSSRPTDKIWGAQGIDG
jgi:RNA polymerase sigma-70 factor (ECF subfamily)